MPAQSILTPTIAAIHRTHLLALEGLYQGIQPARVPALDGPWFGRSHGLSGNNAIDMLEDPQGWLEDVLAEMRAQADRLADEVTFRPAVIELDALGVHFIDALFGAPIRFHGDQVWSEELACDLEDLQPPDLSRSEVFRKALRLAERAVLAARQAAGAGVVYIATPVFACAINIAINLYGERLLESLRARPDAARRVLAVINGTILEATRAFAGVVPPYLRRNSVAENRLAPAGVGQFDGCATQLVSRRDYAEFFAPLDDELMAHSPNGALMHICGAHRQHIPTWRNMAGLRAFQLNDRAMDDLEAYYTGLRPDTVFYLSPSETVPLERILAITGGRRVVLQASLDQPVEAR